MSAPLSSEVRAPSFGAIEWLGIVNVIGIILINGRLDVFLGDSATRQASFIAVALSSVLGIFIALARNRGYLAAAIAIFNVCFAALSLVLFASIYERQVNWNAIFQFSPLFTVSLLFFLARREEGTNLVRIFFWSAVGYAYVYLALNAALAAGALPQNAAAKLVIEDGGAGNVNARGDRIIGYLSLLALGWFSALAAVKRVRNLRGLFYLALFGTCIFLTNSRVYMATIAAVSVLYLFGFSVRTVYRLAVAGLVGACIAYGIFMFVEFNPFEFFAGDASADVRRQTWQVAVRWITEYPWFGVGTPANTEDAHAATYEHFYMSDIGPAGILYAHGIVGLVIWALGPGLLVPREPDAAKRVSYLHIGFALTISQMLLYCIIAPTTWYGGGTLLFAAWIAYVLAQRYRPGASQMPVPQPHSHQS